MSSIPNVPHLAQALDVVASLSAHQWVSVIGVCGLAGAGKTTLCNAIIAARPEHTVRLDCDILSASSLAERKKRIAQTGGSADKELICDEENPQNWYAWYEIRRAIDALRKNRHFRTNRAWNRATGELNASYDVYLPLSGPAVVLCDCIFLLHEPVRTWFDHVLLIRSPDETIAQRRFERTKTQEGERRARIRHDRYELPYFSQHAANADTVLFREVTGSWGSN